MLSLLLQVASAGFVSRQGTYFLVDNHRHYFLSGNFWQGANLGALNRSRLNTELDSLASLNITNLRVMAGSEGPDSEPYRLKPAMQVAPGKYNEEVLVGLDYLLAAMSQRGLRAVMVLSNFWHWSGGFAQYVSWATGTKIPYPNDTGDWGRFQEYSTQFYTCSQCQAWYLQHVSNIISRVNTVSGIRYSEDPAIFSWELGNEPRNFPLQWVTTVAAFIKNADNNHMVTLGTEGILPPAENITSDWIAAHKDENIDYATTHIWVQNRGWYDPKHADSTYDKALSLALDTLQLHVGTARDDIKKPLVFEEFGLARDMEQYTPGTPTTRRDSFYDTMFSTTLQQASLGKGGLCGVGFWAWAGASYPVDPWIGDPPHEPAGWYSVYDKDTSTRAVIKSAAIQLNKLR